MLGSENVVPFVHLLHNDIFKCFSDYIFQTLFFMETNNMNPEAVQSGSIILKVTEGRGVERCGSCSGRELDLRLMRCRFEPHQIYCLVYLSKTLYPLL